MSVQKRLAKVLKQALVVPIDSSSKIILMSDCHRGVGDQADDFLQNQNTFFAALEYYYEHGYTYIELGDGDELWENRSFEAISSCHSDVFWMMSRFYRQNRFYMLYGNHDVVKKKQKFCAENFDTYYCEISCCKKPFLPELMVHEALVLNYQNEQRILLLHGHQADFFNDRMWKLARFLVRYLWKPLELMAFHDPTSTAKNYNKKGKVEEKLAHFAKKEDLLLIAGHTHRSVLPINKNDKYLNDGSCVHPRCITGLEIENGQITLVKWSVRTNHERHLLVQREVLEGPMNLVTDVFQLFAC